MLTLCRFSVKQSPTRSLLAMEFPHFELVERELNLHPSTLQYVRRSMKASRFWGPDCSSLRNMPSFYPSRLEISRLTSFLSEQILFFHFLPRHSYGSTVYI